MQGVDKASILTLCVDNVSRGSIQSMASFVLPPGSQIQRPTRESTWVLSGPLITSVPGSGRIPSPGDPIWARETTEKISGFQSSSNDAVAGSLY